MKAQLIAFGEIEIAGQRYHHDVVINSGKIHQRAKQTAEGGSLRPGFAGTLNDSQTSVSEGLRR